VPHVEQALLTGQENLSSPPFSTGISGFRVVPCCKMSCLYVL
jgi:hypothetical protein